MIEDIVKIVIVCAENAFLQVGVFVGAVLLLFGFINYKRQGGFVKSLEESKRWQPIWGSLLGLSPGCGGAIFVMPLYLKGSVTFGTVIATLIATMGDSAFVLITTLPKTYLLVSIISLVVAIFSGYWVDYLKIDKHFKGRSRKLMATLEKESLSHDIQESDLVAKGYHPSNMNHIGHIEGDAIDILLHHKEGEEEKTSLWAYHFTHHYAYKFFWALTTIGLLLGIALLFQVNINEFLIPDIGTVIGIIGTLFSVVYVFINKKIVKNDSHAEEESKIFSLKETLIHNAEDTAFVNTWVFIAYVIYEVVVYFLGGEVVISGWMTAVGFGSVVVGACIGLIPGCGPQIIFVTLFTKGMVPFAALLANAISQDGDALFPLLAIDKKSSLIATVVTTIPALIIGLLVYFIF